MSSFDPETPVEDSIASERRRIIEFARRHTQVTDLLRQDEERTNEVNHELYSEARLRFAAGANFVLGFQRFRLDLFRDARGQRDVLLSVPLGPRDRVGMADVSVNGRYLAFTRDSSGSEGYTLLVFDLAGPYAVASGLFHNTGRTFHWGHQDQIVTIFSELGRKSLRRINLVDSNIESLIEVGPAGRLAAMSSNDDTQLTVSISCWPELDGVYVLDLKDADSRLSLVSSHQKLSSVRLRGNLAYVLTDDAVQIVQLDNDGDLTELHSFAEDEEFVPLLLEDCGPRLAITGRRRGSASCVLLHMSSPTEPFEIPISPGCAVRAVPGKPDKVDCEVRLSSLAIPMTTIAIDSENNVRQRKDMGVCPPTDLSQERVEAFSVDGTPIPVTLVYRADHDLDGPRPCVAHVYGCYGISLEPLFDRGVLHYLERGVVYALCHVRGGGEFGPAWHQAATGRAKWISVADYLACIRRLAGCPIASGFVDPERIVAEAASAGGFVAASGVLAAPILFAGLHLVNPFLDVTVELLDPTKTRNVSDWAEFGDPIGDPATRVVQGLCWPTRQLDMATLPPIWLRTGLNDSRVPWRGNLRWVNALRELASDQDAVIDIHFDLSEAGHLDSGRTGSLPGGIVEAAWMYSQLKISG